LKIEAPPDLLYPLTLGDSAPLKVGMRVFAIGNPFGLQRTLTVGIISSLNRSLESPNQRVIKDIIQTDAAINPGNSGGPLLDSRGRLIGVNTAIVSRVGQSAGVGFAVPVNTVKRIVPDLIERGRVIRADLGIANVLQVGSGLLVNQLTPGGPAERAGLRGPQVAVSRQGPFVFQQVDRSKADIIVEVDGRQVRTLDDLLSYVESKEPGEKIELTVLRDRKRTSVPVELGLAPQ
jgi:S1-C subfamily serine protease